MRLTRKLANQIDGVDLTRHSVGEVLELPAPDARLLLAENWALLERRQHDRRDVSTPKRRSNDKASRESPGARRRLVRRRREHLTGDRA